MSFDKAQVNDLPPRWIIGVDKRRVGACVGLALIAGFAFGFVTARYLAASNNRSGEGLNRAEASLREDTAVKQPDRYNRVKRVVSADTVEVEGVGVVRMIGIEIPDEKSVRENYGAHGRQARAFAEKSLAGQEVKVELDDSVGPQGETAQLLAYIFTKDGLLFNGEMVRQGYAFVDAGSQFEMIEQFRALEREALQQRRGVWGPGAQPPETPLATAQPSTGNSPATAEGKTKKLAPLLSSEVGPNLPAISGASASPAPGDQSYFVSPVDRMYHKPGCAGLTKKKRALSLGEARAEGFTACSRCFASTVLKAP